ncbi:glycosaminoglycan xylosylkinase homolog [Euwallacea similis]|uniref:glycosaminoglycan xylosylkinase homolog n=1 Tax=Euwallacea similis TaxID=1736056 RepID=UPI00344F9965
MFRKKTVVALGLIVICTFFFMIQYLLKFLPSIEPPLKSNYEKIKEEIYKELYRLTLKSPIQSLNKTEVFLSNLQDIAELWQLNYEKLWLEAQTWPSGNQLTNISSPNIGKVWLALKTAKILKADVDTRGTQLKLLLTLKGNQQCVFKPQWYDKSRLIEGPVYAGKDRYGSEITAFYLSVLLDKPLVPLSVERTLSLKYDIMPVASKRLLNTSFEINNRTCVYGKCYYCHKEDPVCDDNQNSLTGAVILNVKKSFSNYRSPWQRTYKKGKLAAWEIDPNYCKKVKSKLTKKRIFDLIDIAVFDFLIQNGDRHHYETFEDSIVWVDNGKGLGNPYVQHIDILAPLYQCCMMRRKSWLSLQYLAGGTLSKYLKLMPDIQNVLTDAHLKALEERLRLVLATVEYCRRSGDRL